jgi:DNA-binding protein YbaB
VDTTNDWLAGFEAKMADLQRKSTELQQSFATSGATASTPDGGIRVTVGPSGALQDLQLGPSVTRYAPAELAALITRTAAQAQREVAHRVAAAFAPLAEGTDAMSMLESFLPRPAEPVSEAPEDGLSGVDDIDELAPTTGPPTRRPSTKDVPGRDEDFEQPW